MVELDAQDIRFIESHIKERGGIDKAIQVVLKELDATLVLPDGGRPRQTNSYVWQRSDAEFAYLLNKAMDNGMTNEEYAKVMEQYGEVLKKNKLFELENPPVVYSKKVRSSTRKVRVDKVQSMFNGDTLKVGEKAVKAKPKKETVAERKAKILSSKAVTFAFGGLKPKLGCSSTRKGLEINSPVAIQCSITSVSIPV